MKTVFTLFLIFIFGTSAFAQKASLAGNKAVAVAEKIIAPDAQSFSIEKVYPNPVKDLLTIDLRTGVSGAVKVSLINILGTEVKKWDEFFISQGDQKLKLDLSQFKSGMYILKISQQNQVRTQVLKKI